MSAAGHFHTLAKQFANIVPSWTYDDALRYLTRDRFGTSLARKYLKQQRAAAGNARDAGDAPSTPGARHLHELAKLVMRAAGASYEDALNFLLHDRRGRMIATTFKQRDAQARVPKESPMNRIETMLKAAGGSVHGLAKVIVKQGHSEIGENDLTALMVAEARHVDPSLSEAAAFNKMFAAMTPEAEMLRKAHRICQYNKSLDDAFDDPRDGYRQRSQTPADADDDAQKDRTDRLDGLDDDDDEDNGEEYCELEDQAKALQKRMPGLSFAQAFAKVYTDPANRELAKAERARNGLHPPRGR